MGYSSSDWGTYQTAHADKIAEMSPKKAYHDKARFDLLHSDAPQRLDEFRRQAQPLIHEQFQGGLVEMLSTLASQQRTQQSQTTDQLANFGVNPAAALGRLIPQQNQQFAEMAGGARGQAVAGEAGAQMDLFSQLTSALNQVESYYDVLQLQNSLASKDRAAARQAGRNANTTALLGAGIGAAGMALGGPGGYFSKP